MAEPHDDEINDESRKSILAIGTVKLNESSRREHLLSAAQSKVRRFKQRLSCQFEEHSTCLFSAMSSGGSSPGDSRLVSSDDNKNALRGGGTLADTSTSGTADAPAPASASAM